RQRRMQLPVIAEVTYVTAQLIELGVDHPAAPEQPGNGKQQGQKEQGAFFQASRHFRQCRMPTDAAQLSFQALRKAGQPAEIQRLFAGNPEHLLVQRGAQCAGSVVQLLLVELQGNGFVEQRADFAVQTVEQFAAGFDQVQQCPAQLRCNQLFGLV